MSPNPYSEPLHPVRHEALTPLERDLWRLGMVSQEAEILLRGLNHYKDAAASLNQDILFTVTNQASIIICKFLEVWSATSSHAKTDPRVVPRRRAAQPMVDRIKVWKGLDLFRNSTLAHPYLTSDGKLIEPRVIIREYGVPAFSAEVLLLLHLTRGAVLIFLDGFQTEFLALWPLSNENKFVVDPSPGIKLSTEIDPELRRVLGQADEILRREGLTIDPAFGREFERRVRPPVDPV